MTDSHRALDSTENRLSQAIETPLVDAELLIGGLGSRFFSLLQAIEAKKSLVYAAKASGLSYKGAWSMIERAEALSPRPLIERNPGGGQGRGTRLTETGLALLAFHGRVELQKQLFLAGIQQNDVLDPLILQWHRKIRVQTSCRNQWRGEILSLKLGAVRALVTVRLEGGAVLIANLGRNRMVEEKMPYGVPALVLVKSSSVQISPDPQGYQWSHENQMPGTLLALRRDPASIEALIELPGGDRVVMTSAIEEFEALDLSIGHAVRVLINASEVLLAVPVNYGDRSRLIQGSSSQKRDCK